MADIKVLLETVGSLFGGDKNPEGQSSKFAKFLSKNENVLGQMSGMLDSGLANFASSGKMDRNTAVNMGEDMAIKGLEMAGPYGKLASMGLQAGKQIARGVRLGQVKEDNVSDLVKSDAGFTGVDSAYDESKYRDKAANSSLFGSGWRKDRRNMQNEFATQAANERTALGIIGQNKMNNLSSNSIANNATNRSAFNTTGTNFNKLSLFKDGGKLKEKIKNIKYAGGKLVPKMKIKLNNTLNMDHVHQFPLRIKDTKEIPTQEFERKARTSLFKMFKQGGQMNIIPSGVLHARKHSIFENFPELKGQITHKGIPVVSKNEDGGVIEQQAEIEVAELILTLENSKRLKEFYEEYEDDPNDDLLIELGKWFSKQLNENTKDNTNELLNVES